MNYVETIEYLFTRLPMFSRMGSAAFRKDLTNIVALCEVLGNPHTRFKSIHVGGTNGKGSVSHMLAAVLQTAGYKTGLYTSPHLHDFRERIKVNGAMVSEACVTSFVEKIKPSIEALQPSFFEITVAMAFDYFAQEGVDIAVIEVGLGGRLDSTNIITPELSVITNISLDHTNMLGHSLQEIATEKAGIIKKGVPVVIGERHAETAPVFITTSKEKEAPLSFAEDHFAVKEWKQEEDLLKVTVINTDSGQEETYLLDLPGLYQTKNIKSVLQATAVLRQRGWRLKEKDIHSALARTKQLTGLYGRWEVVHQRPRVVLEVAHNEDGIRQMLAHIEQLTFKQLHLVFGMVKDKDIEPVLHLLPREAFYYFTQAHIPRALPAAELQQQAASAGLKGTTYTDVNAALKEALDQASEDDLVIVCGSIFLVAEVDRQKLDG